MLVQRKLIGRISQHGREFTNLTLRMTTKSYGVDRGHSLADPGLVAEPGKVFQQNQTKH